MTKVYDMLNDFKSHIYPYWKLLSFHDLIYGEQITNFTLLEHNQTTIIYPLM